MGPEQQRLMDRMFSDPTRKLVNFKISAGDTPESAEKLCAEINGAMDQVERRRAAGDMGDGPIMTGKPRINLRELLESDPMGKAGKKIIAGLQEAVGLSRAYGVLDTWLDPDHIRLHAGEMSAQEMRSVLAVLRAVRADLAHPRT